MTRPQYTSLTTAGASAWTPLDHRGCGKYMVTTVVSAGGNLTYSLEFTNDDIDAGAPTNAHSHATMASKTDDFTATLEPVPRAVRLNVTSYTGGTATMQLIPGDRI